MKYNRGFHLFITIIGPYIILYETYLSRFSKGNFYVESAE
jgi:hypothetical protein